MSVITAGAFRGFTTTVTLLLLLVRNHKVSISGSQSIKMFVQMDLKKKC